MKKSKFKTILILTSIYLFALIIPFYGFEAYLTFIRDNQLIQKKAKILKDKTGIVYDTRSKFEAYNDMKKTENITPMYYPSLSMYNETIMPLAGLSNTNTLFCNENGIWEKYVSDKYGFRNQLDIWNIDNFDLVLIGDSYVQGQCVNTDNIISEIITKKTDKKVLNLGYSGTGPLTNLATYIEYKPQKVKKLIWFYYEGNDLIDLSLELKSKTLLKYLMDDNFNQNLKERQNEINKYINYFINNNEEFQVTKKKFSFFYFSKLYKTRGFIKSYFTNNRTDKELLNYFSKAIDRMKSIISDNNTDLLIVYLPEYSSILNRSPDDEYYFIKKLLKNKDIEFLDFYSEVINKLENPLQIFPFELSGHYNEYGYETLSDFIISEMH